MAVEVARFLGEPNKRGPGTQGYRGLTQRPPRALRYVNYLAEPPANAANLAAQFTRKPEPALPLPRRADCCLNAPLSCNSRFAAIGKLRFSPCPSNVAAPSVRADDMANANNTPGNPESIARGFSPGTDPSPTHGGPSTVFGPAAAYALDCTASARAALANSAFRTAVGSRYRRRFACPSSKS